MSAEVMQQWIHEVGQRVGSPDLKLEGNTCTLEKQDTKLVIEYEEDTDSAHLWSEIATLPQELDSSDYADLYATLLTENLTGQNTGGARFALDADPKRIILCESLTVRENFGNTFHALVPMMLAMAQQWYARFHDLEA